MSVKIAQHSAANTMRAWVMAQQGGPEELKQVFVEVPQPGPRELRVKIAAATLNPADWKRVHFGGPLPAVFGLDGAGIVDAVGGEVTEPHLQRGARVHFFNNVWKEFGTYADYSIVDASAVVVVPPTLSFAQAAVSPCAGWTAYEALFDRLRIESGRTIYIASGAGGVGHYAIQLAGNAGLHVITTASGANLERLRSVRGVAKVIDYKTQDVKKEIMDFTHGQGVDYVFEMLGEAETKVSLECLKFGGAICHIAGSVPSLPNNFLHAITAHHVCIPGNLTNPPALRKFTDIGAAFAQLLADGKVQSDISKTVGFGGIGEALVEQAKGRVRGKILISFSDPLDKVNDVHYAP